MEHRKKHGSVFDVLDYNFGSNLEWRNDDEARSKLLALKFGAAKFTPVTPWDPRDDDL